MKILERKIPPPVVGILAAALAWLVADWVPWQVLRSSLRIPVALVLVLSGLALDSWSIFRFLKAGTSVNPLSSERTVAVVRSGPYRFTRNPMYLGMGILLFGYCIYLGNPLTLAAVVLYWVYMTRFQIIPEEKALTEKFGEPYIRFLAETRRWL